MSKPWTPYDSLTSAPTNLKEAIDWVLRVTGKDGKENDKAASPPQFGCLCYLAKAVKDLLYDARSPGSPGPSSKRNWDDILLDQEKTIVQPVLTDLGLLSTQSTTTTCAGGTEVIKALIGQLAQGLQKWVGWQDRGDECCLKGDSSSKESKGIGKKCDCTGNSGTCCGNGGSKNSHECTQCGKDGTNGKCYLSAYCKARSTTSSGSSTPELFLWTSISSDSTKVHLLARIFLGSVCLIWSGLSQLGFLTKEVSGGDNRWSKGELHEISGKDNAGLGSFMAAMGYDLERLNGSGGQGKYCVG